MFAGKDTVNKERYSETDAGLSLVYFGAIGFAQILLLCKLYSRMIRLIIVLYFKKLNKQYIAEHAVYVP